MGNIQFSEAGGATRSYLVPSYLDQIKREESQSGEKGSQKIRVKISPPIAARKGSKKYLEYLH